jgi:arsenate reductase (glutaredoxin)
MITIYHNPRCSKSRECNVLLAASGKEVQVINYIETPFSVEKLKELIGLLNIKPIKLVRTSEQLWKDNYKGKKMNDAEVIKAMVQNPKLIQRPIVVNENKAFIARPVEKICEIL